MRTEISERQIEDVFEIYHEELLEPGLKLISRQYVFNNGRRADLIFLDQKKRKIVVELKRNSVTRADVGQLIEYRGIMDDENPRIVLVAPIIPLSIKKAFEHFGIEYLEFSLVQIGKLLDQITTSPNTLEKKKPKIEPKKIISEPLSSKRIKDGNVAFKVTYVDNNWSNVCSPNVADYNFKNRTWCKIQKDFEINCQSSYWKNNEVSLDGSPCHDCIALKELCFYPGHNHGPKTSNEPRRMLNAKQGKIVVFTSNKPGAGEEQRFIFAIAEIAGFAEVEEGGQAYEMLLGKFDKALYFQEGTYPLFWNYYQNPNAPNRKAWNTGLFRYMNDRQTYNLLKDINNIWSLSDQEHSVCNHLLEKVQ